MPTRPGLQTQNHEKNRTLKIEGCGTQFKPFHLTSKREGFGRVKKAKSRSLVVLTHEETGVNFLGMTAVRFGTVRSQGSGV